MKRMLLYGVVYSGVGYVDSDCVGWRTIAYNRCRVAYVYVGLALRVCRFAYDCAKLLTVCANRI